MNNKHWSIANVVHEANRAYCASLGDDSQKPWLETPLNIQQSALDGVAFVLANPDASDSANHDNWSKFKIADGWVYGPVKNETAKTHHCLVPFDQLPVEHQRKDKLFRAIVLALA